MFLLLQYAKMVFIHITIRLNLISWLFLYITSMLQASQIHPFKETSIEDVNINMSMNKPYIFVSLTSSNCYDFTINSYYTDSFDKTKTFYFKRFNKSCGEEHPSRIDEDVKVRLPDTLIYFDEQNMANPTNYYVDQVEVQISLLYPDGSLVGEDIETLPLKNPWYRPLRPRYCRNWQLHIQSILKRTRIPKSPLVDDPVLLPSIVSLAGKDFGFTRKLEPSKWPLHVPQHVRVTFESNSKFTLSFWIFLSKYCASGMCMIFQHRNSTNFFSPLVLLNREGAFHVQFHAKDGAGTAFTSQKGVPLNTWLFLILSIDGARAEMTLSFGKGSPYQEFVHLHNEPFFFNSTEGIYSIGGFMGNSFSGFITSVNLYRNQKLNKDYILRNIELKRDKLNELDLSKFIGDCSKMKYIVQRDVLKLRRIGDCPAQLHWWHIRDQNPKRHGKFRDERNILPSYHLGKLKDTFAKSKLKNQYSLEAFAKILFGSTLKAMEKKTIINAVAVNLLEICGCLGFHKGYYLSAVMHKYGLGVKTNPLKTLKMHLLAAEKDYPLAQMALAYRHQLGIDGAPKDDSIVAGYIRNIAVKSKMIHEREDHESVTFSEMIRLDQVHLFRDQRGSTSQLVKWLAQQAKSGSLEAKNKIAEIFYNGKQGAKVDRSQAFKFYEMAAADNDTAAIFNLGVMHLKGIAVPKNTTKAFMYFKKAAEHQNSIAFNSMAFVELVHNKNRSGAIVWWKKAADVEDGDGLNNYAQVLEAGIEKEGTGQNHSEALKYYLRAASRGQKNGCIKVGDYMIVGEYTERQVGKAVDFYRAVADHINDVGICLKDAIDAYADGRWYMSLVHHLLVTEAGIQLGGYNTALLLREYEGYTENVIEKRDPYYYYNLTAEQGWSLSMLEMGHYNWYNNKSSRSNFLKASQYYARSIEKDNHPEALYSLAYIIEHGYPIHSDIRINNRSENSFKSEKFKMASQLYHSCVTSEAENKEGFYPCHLALLRIHWKMFLQENPDTVFFYSTVCLAVVMVTVSTIRTYTFFFSSRV